MSASSSGADPTAVAERFETSMIGTGTVPVVAAELERRIEIIERDELSDLSRARFSGREIAAYVGVTVLAVAIGAVLVAL